MDLLNSYDDHMKRYIKVIDPNTHFIFSIRVRFILFMVTKAEDFKFT